MWKACLAASALAWSAAAGGAECRVAVDIGHDRQHPGALSARGVPEWEFNRALAGRLVPALVARGIPAFLVDPEVAPALGRRPEIAQARGATLLLSIHHDSVQPRYLSPWRWRGRDLAYCDSFRGFGLFVSAGGGAFEASEQVAADIGDRLLAAGLSPSLHHAEPIPGEGRPLLDRARGIYRYDGLAVLRGSAIPAVLIEAAVIVHRREEVNARSARYQRRIVDALVAAAAAHCGRLGSPRPTAPGG